MAGSFEPGAGLGEMEGKVHEDLVLSKMSETFVVHIVFNLSEHGLRFYASLPSVFQSFLRAEQFFGSPLVLPKPMIQFYHLLFSSASMARNIS